jgi:hypothetical protein
MDSQAPRSRRQADALVVDQRGVLDGVDAGADGVLDAEAPWAWAATFRPCRWASSADRLHLLEAELLGARLGVAREDAAGRADLDHLRAVLAHLAHAARASSAESML